MKTAIVLAVLLAGCATVPEGDRQITIKADRVKECQEEGGCALLSKAQVLALMQQAYQLGAAAVVDSLDTHGCRKGDV